MIQSTANSSNSVEPKLLGPFLGHVTTNSIKIWLHFEGPYEDVYVTLHEKTFDAPMHMSATLSLRAERLFTDCVTVKGLEPDTKYFYRIWTDADHSVPFSLDGLDEKELRFWTLSEKAGEQIDFVVMSCHNPSVARADGYEGHAVWADLPQIIARDSNKKVRFALLVGDQVYADDWEKQVLAEKNEEGRIQHYLSAYRQYWSNIHYRRVMCSLPAVMMWDDHDITDGWGSRTDSFVDSTSDFKPEWKGLFDAAFKTFSTMQASRNPAPLTEKPQDGLDFGFKVGQWGFIFLDLRTNRNLRLGRLHTDEQFDRIREWVEANQKEIQTLFVISPVVFSHGSPVVEDLTLKAWPFVMRIVAWVANWGKWGRGIQTKFDKSLGDISDDIKDSWGSRENEEQADRLLDFLFDLQNHPVHRVNTVIVSGDIHTSGYANIYSSDQKHAGASSIAHITSSSVAYTPFNWLLEAVYRYASKTVALGKRGVYSSQISHHFCARSVAVFSMRPGQTETDHQLKVKYYLEGFPEPQTLTFDLNSTSHRENITWVAQSKLSDEKYAPTALIDVDQLLVMSAKESTQELNWKESIVDLMKLLQLDSSLGSRKRLAQQWGYNGALNGSAEMNIFLLEQMKKRLQDSGGNIPDDVPTAEY